MLVQLGQPDRAVQVLQEFVQRNPDNIEVRVQLGDLLLQAGRVDLAAPQFEVALRNAPDHAGAQLGYAWILFQNGDVGAARRRFESLFRTRNLTPALFGAGMCQIEQQQFGEAERTFEEVLRRQPDYWQALGNLAGLYEQTGRLDEARRMYSRLLQF
ncbi:MAG: tetratricopeptide repeat protein, partial [Gammaproteobacteria bacterium]|nr:tetratricopeptide repeat protein [Gammaproteobacteria bacterium]